MSITTANNIDNLLLDVGLSISESKIYKYLLRHGESTAITISKETAIKRTHVYNLLSQLESKKLVSHKDIKPKKIYLPENPSNLKLILKERKHKLENVETLLTTNMSGLISDFELHKQLPGVYLFKGREGIERVYEELLKDRLDVNSIVDRRILRNTLGSWNDFYIHKRKRNKIKSRVITLDSSLIDTIDSLEQREVKYLPAKLFPFKMDLKVTAKKVVMTTFEKKSLGGIILTNKDIVKNFLILFEFLWNIAKES